MQKRFWIRVLGFVFLVGITLSESVRSIWTRWMHHW